MSVGSDRPNAGALASVDAIHGAVDAAVAPLERRHAERLRCHRGCSGCCVDHISVFAVEAEKIRRDYPELVREGRPYPEGACAFLDATGSCRIYGSRPYVCRTQGLPLRWLESRPDGRVLEYRDICPLNVDPDAPAEALPAGDCWTIGQVEASLAAVQSRLEEGEPRRVRLRALFRRSEPLELPAPEPEAGG